MKRFTSFVIMISLVVGLLPAAKATDPEVTWYADWDVLSRLYGTDRMILVKNDLCALYGLDGTKYTEPVFDAIGEYNAQGHAAAMKNGKWGKIDRNGNTVTDFLYDTLEEVPGDRPGREAGEKPVFHEGLRCINREGGHDDSQPTEKGWGFEDETGRLVVPYLYDTVGHFDHGYASVTVDGIYGLLKNPLSKKAEEPGENEPEVPASTFADVPAGSWFEKGVMTCAQSGIMVGTGENTFSPNATLTDAESLMLGYRLYDKANGGDGSLMKMPEDYGYIRIISDDGSFVHEGYASDGSLWEVPNIHYSSEGYRLCLRGYTNGKPGGATLTFGGKEYRGTLQGMYRGSGRYEQDRFFGFEPEDPTLNHLMFDACYDTAPPTRWWADLLYTIDQKGWKKIFSNFLLLFGNEDYRGGFADLLGAVTDLPKLFDIPPIPDLGEREEGNPYREHIYEMYESGIIGGVDAYGTFASEKTLTRAEAAVMVARVLDESQRLTTPPKPMPKEGEGYTLTYLMDGVVETGSEQNTYPYYFVEDPALDWPRRHKGFLKLDGTFTPWPESDVFYTLDWFGGDTFYWTNIYENEDGSQRYEEGGLNEDMEWIIEPQYLGIWPREGGYAAVTNDGRYLLLDGKGAVEQEVAGEEELPDHPGYNGPWEGWQNWGGLTTLPDGTYYRRPDGSPATQKFDWCGKIGPDGQGFVQKDGKIYRIAFTLPVP